jgi:hypothetical protein
MKRMAGSRRRTQSADRNFWPGNDKSCHKFGGCPFRKVCNSAPAIRPQLLEANYTVKQWNPLESR